MQNWQQKISQEYWSRNLWKLSVEKFYVWSVNIEADGHMGSSPGYAFLIWQGEATKPRKDVFRERIGKIMERSLSEDRDG